MSRVAVSSATVTTDPFSTLTVASHTFTGGALQIQNKGSSTASFRIKNQSGTVVTPTDIPIAAGAAATFTVSKLTPGSTTNYNLERLEYGTYVAQNSDPTNVNNLTSLTTDIMSLSVSTGSVHATAAFTVPASVAPAPEVVVLVQNTSDFNAGTTNNMQMISVPAGSGVQSVGLNGLTAATGYTAVLMTRDRSTPNTRYPDGFAENTIDVKTFTTSLSGNLTVGTPYASYVALSWTGDSSEKYRVVDAKGAVVSPDGPPTSMTVYNLVPGTTYTFVLQIKNGSNYVNSAAATCTTPTTTLTIQGVTDTACSCSWTAMYDKAAYELSVTNNTSKAVEQTLDTSALTQVVKGLRPSTSYTLQLSVIENNTAQPVSRAVLGTASPSTANSSNNSFSAPATVPASYDGKTDPGTNAASTEPNPKYGKNTSSGPSASSSHNVNSSNSVQSTNAKLPDHLVLAVQKANEVVVPGAFARIEIAAVLALACLCGYGIYKTHKNSK